MAIQYTDEQKQAIETLDRSILVSAAAGSGKTAILVQRILRIVLEGKADVDAMLVVTFTKAAAAEMRLRLAKAIRKHMAEHPEDAPRMKDQLIRLQRAYISTIDSFALRVIREFFYETDLEPDFSICDDVQAELLKREAIEELFEAGFMKDDLVGGCGFREFLRLYSSDRSEENLMNGMLDSYNRLRSMPDYFEWAYSHAEELMTGFDDLDGSAVMEAMRQDAEETLRIASDAALRVKMVMEDAGLGKLYEEKLEPEVKAIAEMYGQIRENGSVIDMTGVMNGITYARMNVKKEYKEAWNAVKDDVTVLRDAYKEELKGWKERYLLPDLETRVREMNETGRYTVYYIKLLEEFERRYAEKKRERRVVDFADTEHYAVRILRNDEASAVMKKRFRFVFVDEYQDTNNIQECLISRVSGPDNVFRVGDIKQSIYKFRQAEPEIFERVYREYSDPENADGMTIDLSKNFRTNDRTIRYINEVFSAVMEGYDDRAKLYTGCHCEEVYDFIPEVHVLLSEDAAEDEETDSAGTEDDETLDLSREEAEAAYIADLAAGIIGMEFYDTKAGRIRKAAAGDIAILFRAVKVRGEVMTRALRSRGIDAHVDDSGDYFDTVEISVALSLLTCIDNMKRDVPLIASLHSAAFGWTPEDLAEVRIAHSEYARSSGEKEYRRAAYWEALRWYTENGPDERLKAKASLAADKLFSWRTMSRMMPLADFVWTVLVDSGLYSMAGTMNGGSRRQANLRTLADRAEKFGRDNAASLSSFITFVDVMKSRKISNAQTPAAGTDGDVVRISTIHKSKGLEYPFVIVGGLGHRFRYDNAGKGLSMDPALGLGLQYVDPARKYYRTTLMQKAISVRANRDSYREELRVLYVALTRARNKLMLVGTCKSAEELVKYRARPANYLQVMRDVLRTEHNKIFIRPLDFRDRERKDRADGIIGAVPEVLPPEAAAMYEEIDRRFRYEYPDKELLKEKSKYSVSEIRRAEVQAERDKENAAGIDADDVPAAGKADDEVVRLWTMTEARRKAGGADTGIAYHRVMEYLDPVLTAGADGGVDEEYISGCAERLGELGAIDPEVLKNVDPSRIAEFFRSDLGRRVRTAAGEGRLYREKPFTLRTERNGRRLLVQGVIDCCFEEDGRMVLIDYKSNFIRPGRAREKEIERIRREYRVQIELYAEAVRKGTGKAVSEAYLYLFAAGEAVRMQ